MKAKIEIPRGWKRLRPGTEVRKTDKVWWDYGEKFIPWAFPSYEATVDYDEIVIRRRAARRGR